MRVHAHVYEIPAGELSLNSDARKLTDDPPLQRGSSKGHREPSRGWKDLDRRGGHRSPGEKLTEQAAPLGIVCFRQGCAWGTQAPLQSPHHNPPTVAVQQQFVRRGLICEWGSGGPGQGSVLPRCPLSPSRASRALAMAAANWVASSLLPKLRPQTWRVLHHLWKVGVAWLYLIPQTMAQLMTTCWSGCTFLPTTWKELAVVLWYIWMH